MPNIQAAVQWAVNIANDDTHGYSQANRYGPDYDCSSFVAAALIAGGFNVPATMWTGNERSCLLAAGYTEITPGTAPVAGDIGMTHIPGGTQHTGMYISPTQFVQASADYDGVPGDSGGNEIWIGPAPSTANWQYLFRYYGATAWISDNRYLSTAEMQNNAEMVFQYGTAHGWSLNAIAAMCGNMQSESGINPGIWEGLTPYSGGYGLVQWTPYTKYSDWATQQGYTWQDNGDAEMERISYEAANGLQWFRNEELGMDPPITFQQFLTSTLPPETLADYWCWFYEHPANPNQPARATQARAWYDYLGGLGGTVPVWLLFKFVERRRAQYARSV